MNKKLEELAECAGFMDTWFSESGEVDVEKFAELIIREHLSIWERMDNGNKVAGYVEMEDYPKAIKKYFGMKNDY